MKISLKWINDFVDVSEYFSQPQALADLLTRAGLEVEEIHQRASDLAHVVIGHIQVKDKHPNADKLSLCQVDVGSGKILQIVCGAQNHKALDKVIVALPGAVLPGNFAIKKSKIRDVESHGMLCSNKELGLAGESDGIVILPTDAPAGKSFAEYAGYDDVTFELKVTPNRADCLSHYGLARELGCLLNKPVRSPEVLTKFAASSTRQKIQLRVEDAVLCPRYCGRFISGVRVGESPEWLKKRLETVGQNSINNVVDVTNYVMLEMGQPLHAFDADSLKGAQVVVRRAKKDEPFQTLKEENLILTGDELLICDSEKPVALAGVIGGLNSGVSDQTKNIFIESASFEAMSVRKSSRHHGVETDSAYRFSRGVDPSSTATIMDRAALLIQQLAGGEVYGEAYDHYPSPPVKKPIAISLQTISDRLGYAADEKLFLNYMQGLQIKVESKGNGQYLMTPPLFRFDLEQDMDLVEEYARLNGYENIQEKIPALKVEPSSQDAFYLFQQRLSAVVRSSGFHQAFNYAFTNDAAEKKMMPELAPWSAVGLAADQTAIAIRNPLSEEINVMRRTLTTMLWKNTLENIRSGNAAGSLFEVGSVFSKKETEYIEKPRMALVSWGEPTMVHSLKAAPVERLRAVLEKLFQNLQISAYSFVTGGQSPAFVHHGQWASVVVEGQAIGFIGSMHPGWLQDEKVRVPVAVAEIDLQTLQKAQSRPVKFKPLSKFQPIERDFAFVMLAQKSIGDLMKEAKKACGSALKEMTVFDIYEGDKLAHGQKSVALRATFQGQEAMLAEAEIQQLCQKFVEAAQKAVQATLRE